MSRGQYVMQLDNGGELTIWSRSDDVVVLSTSNIDDADGILLEPDEMLELATELLIRRRAMIS